MMPTCVNCRAVLVRCTRRRRCLVCERDHFCLVCPARCSSICTKERSDRQLPSGLGWWHVHRRDSFISAPPRRPQPKVQPTPRAKIEQRHDVYVSLLREHLVLSTSHRAELQRRGLSDFAIERNCYRSTPTPDYTERIARTLDWHGLVGVPGFYRAGDCWRMVRCAAGFFVPYRDERGRIQAMQYRLDEPLDGKTKYLWLSSRECSSGTPIHHANHQLLADAQEVTVTEGALKADVIAYLTSQPVVAAAGVNCFGADFSSHLRTVASRLRTVIIAFDMDMLQNCAVRVALEALTTQLQRAGFNVRVRTWPPQFKGLDDYLAQFQQQEVCAA